MLLLHHYDWPIKIGSRLWRWGDSCAIHFRLPTARGEAAAVDKVGVPFKFLDLMSLSVRTVCLVVYKIYKWE